MATSLRPHGLQHIRLFSPPLSPGVCSDSRPLSWWCHSTIWSSVIRFSSCPQSFPPSGPFQLFASGGQSFGASASVFVLPMNIQGWSFRIDWFDLLVVQGLLKSLLQHHIVKASILWCLAFFMVQLSHPLPYLTTGKTIALTRCLYWQSDVFAF